MGILNNLHRSSAPEEAAPGPEPSPYGVPGGRCAQGLAGSAASLPRALPCACSHPRMKWGPSLKKKRETPNCDFTKHGRGEQTGWIEGFHQQSQDLVEADAAPAAVPQPSRSRPAPLVSGSWPSTPPPPAVSASLNLVWQVLSGSLPSFPCPSVPLPRRSPVLERAIQPAP